MPKKLEDFFDKTVKKSRYYDDFKYFEQFKKKYFFVDKNVHTASNGLKNHVIFHVQNLIE